jgi:copper chaperone
MSGTLILSITAVVGGLTHAGCEEGGPAATATSTPAAPGGPTSAATTTIEFEVKGMSCEGCVFSVRNAIAKIDGVESCDVSLAEERATVAVRDQSIMPTIIEAVEKLDFKIAQRTGSNGDADG